MDESKGRQFRLIANSLDFENADHTSFRADTQATTAVAVCKPYVYTVSKDKTLIKWEIAPPTASGRTNGVLKRSHTGKRKPRQVAYVKGIKVRASVKQQHGHTGAILSLAVSPDGQFVATGGADKKLIIWSASDLRPLKTFYMHRDAVTGLDFAPSQSNQSGFGAQLFSASMDRSIKTYSLAGEDSLAYVETLFGHKIMWLVFLRWRWISVSQWAPEIEVLDSGELSMRHSSNSWVTARGMMSIMLEVWTVSRHYRHKTLSRGLMRAQSVSGVCTRRNQYLPYKQRMVWMRYRRWRT